MSDDLALAAFLSLCSGALEKPIQEQTAILGTLTIGGSISSIENLSDLLQVCLDAGAKKGIDSYFCGIKNVYSATGFI